jgi:hypothetical protein
MVFAHNPRRLLMIVGSLATLFHRRVRQEAYTLRELNATSLSSAPVNMYAVGP